MERHNFVDISRGEMKYTTGFTLFNILVHAPKVKNIHLVLDNHVFIANEFIITLYRNESKLV